MKLISILKICVLAAFVGTLFTGFLFVMRSSDEQQMRAHAKDIYAKGEKDASDIKSIDINGGLIDVNKNTQIDEPKYDDKAKEEDTINDVKEVIIEAPAIQPEIKLSTPKPTSSSIMIKSETVPPKILKELKETSRPHSIHIFYYPWYGTPEFDDGKYYHWNHMYLKQNGEKVDNPDEHHHPPGDIASISYPQLGPYSSSNPAVIERHMKWLSSAGVDVVVASWYPKEKSDANGKPLDSLFPVLLNVAEKFKIKLAFHLEPYQDRTAASIRDDITYIIKEYGSHPSFYRTTSKTKSDKQLPLFYVYDSYLIEAEEWLKLTSVNGSLTIRNTDIDSLLIGLYVNAGDDLLIKKARFDGLYTYFAAEGFSHGSTMNNWPALSTFCAKENLLFIPSVGPGYDDSRIRPWNTKNNRSRNKGEYYIEHFKMAHTSRADIVSITSFNEWMEGTQIEPAVPFTANSTGYIYSAYDKGPEQYLEITLKMVQTYFTPFHENIPMQISRVV